MNLSAVQKRFWNENGFIVLEGFFAPKELGSIANLHERIWRERPDNVVVDDMETGERLIAANIAADKAQMRYKINDLYLVEEKIRSVGLHERLVPILENVMVDRPVLINSLDVDYGTQQPFHVDSLYMTPAAPFNLAAVWVALEDASADSGPLEYYPGSHLIPPFKFSDGSNHVIDDEMPAWKSYMTEQVEKFGLKVERFIPKTGDILIWHTYLLHRGALANDPALTRKSVIFHYYGESICKFQGLILEPLNGAFWERREPVTKVQIRETAIPLPEPVPEVVELPVQDPGIEEDLNMGKAEKFLRTTLHHMRNWQRDIGSLFQ